MHIKIIITTESNDLILSFQESKKTQQRLKDGK